MAKNLKELAKVYLNWFPLICNYFSTKFFNFFIITGVIGYIEFQSFQRAKCGTAPLFLRRMMLRLVSSKVAKVVEHRK